MSQKHWAPFARGSTRRKKPGEMNATEAKYAEYLDGLKADGVILWYLYEGMTFKLGKDCRYTPDFDVMLPDGTIELHETKGHWTEQAKVKIRVAADLFPFRFVAKNKQPKKAGGGWSEQEF